MSPRTPLLALPLLLAFACAGPERNAGTWITYVCEDGRALQARYPDERTVQLKLGDARFRLRIAVSGSGARYVGEGLQWWAKGDEAMLAPLKAGQAIADEPGVRCAAATTVSAARPARVSAG